MNSKLKPRPRAQSGRASELDTLTNSLSQIEPLSGKLIGLCFIAPAPRSSLGTCSPLEGGPRPAWLWCEKTQSSCSLAGRAPSGAKLCRKRATNFAQFNLKNSNDIPNLQLAGPPICFTWVATKELNISIPDKCSALALAQLKPPIPLAKAIGEPLSLSLWAPTESNWSHLHHLAPTARPSSCMVFHPSFVGPFVRLFNVANILWPSSKFGSSRCSMLGQNCNLRVNLRPLSSFPNKVGRAGVLTVDLVPFYSSLTPAFHDGAAACSWPCGATILCTISNGSPILCT